MYNYDQDYSEVEDLLDNIEEDDPIEEKKYLLKLLQDFGTVALVLYHRLKQEDYFKNYLLYPINHHIISPELMATSESIMTLIK